MVVADLAVDVGRLPAYVREVEEDAGEGWFVAGEGGRELGCVDVVEEFVFGDAGMFVAVFFVGGFGVWAWFGGGSGGFSIVGCFVFLCGRGGRVFVVDDGNVGVDGGVFCDEFGVVLVKDCGGDIDAAVMFD